MNGITINKDSDGNVREVRYLTDDRDQNAAINALNAAPGAGVERQSIAA